MGRAFQQIMPLTRLGSFQGGWLAERVGLMMRTLKPFEGE
jgi:hypothetical protein